MTTTNQLIDRTPRCSKELRTFRTSARIWQFRWVGWELPRFSLNPWQASQQDCCPSFMANRMATWANPETAPPMGGSNER